MKNIDPKVTFLFLDAAGEPIIGKSIFTGWNLFVGVQKADGSYSHSMLPDYAGVWNITQLPPLGYYLLTIYKNVLPDDPLFKLHLQLIPPSGDDVKFVVPDYYEELCINAETIQKIEELDIKLDAYGSLVLTEDNSNGFNNIQIRAKENDDIVFTLQVPSRHRPLTGWTNISVQMFPKERSLDPTVQPITGTYEATVTDAVNGIIRCRIGRDVTANKVPANQETEQFYADVQGHNPNGLRFTFAQCDITLIRDYNINHQP